MIVYTMRLCSSLTGYKDILHVGQAEKYHLSRRHYVTIVVERKVVPMRVHNDLPYAFHCSPLNPLSSFLSLSFLCPLSFFHLPPAPLSSPFLQSPIPRIVLSMKQLIRRPFHPPEADSAERSETIKSTAESTLPCKLAHCQAQRFTVTCIAYIYIYIF